MLSLDTVTSYLERIGLDFEYASEYGEPGYSTAKPAILFANWNRVPRGRMAVIERSFECEWSDEWHIAYDSTSKAYRTSPDCYGWTSSLVYTDGDYLTPDDIAADPEALVSILVNDPSRCMTPTTSVDLASLGFSLVVEDQETGFHPGQTDDPRAVLKRLETTMPEHDFIFDVTDVGQFDSRWQVWARPW